MPMRDVILLERHRGGAKLAPSMFLTDVPPDHDTVWGFLCREEPHVLELMLDPVRSPLTDQARAKVVAACLGSDYLPVKSPPAVEAAGIPEVFAFSIGVLREVFPSNP